MYFDHTHSPFPWLLPWTLNLCCPHTPGWRRAVRWSLANLQGATPLEKAKCPSLGHLFIIIIPCYLLVISWGGDVATSQWEPARTILTFPQELEASELPCDRHEQVLHVFKESLVVAVEDKTNTSLIPAKLECQIGTDHRCLPSLLCCRKTKATCLFNFPKRSELQGLVILTVHMWWHSVSVIKVLNGSWINKWLQLHFSMILFRPWKTFLVIRSFWFGWCT